MRLTFCFSRNWRPYPTIFALRSRPCCPGAKFRFSMPQEGLKHLSPFRNSFIPSLRHNLHTGPIYLATLNSPSLWGTAPIVWNRRYVSNRADLQASRLEGPDRRIASGARPLDIDFERAHSRFTRPVRSGKCGLLRRDRGSLG